MGFLGTVASSFADMTLVDHIAGFIILFSGSLYVKRKDFSKHFILTRIAVFLGIVSLIWMGYSLISHFLTGALFLDTTGYLLILHATIGSLALFGGVFFAFDRLIRKTIIPMRIVFLLWTAALFLGIIFYISYYNVLVLF